MAITRVRKALLNGIPVNQTIPNNQVNPYAVLTWDQVLIDEAGAFNPANNSFLVPPGFTKARFTLQAVWLQFMRPGQLVIWRRRAGEQNFGFWDSGSPVLMVDGGDMAINVAVPLPVAEGDEFIACPWQESGGPVNISGGSGTYFAIELLP